MNTPTTAFSSGAGVASAFERIYLKDYFAELGHRRGNHARRASGKKLVKQAEALQRTLPLVVDSI